MVVLEEEEAAVVVEKEAAVVDEGRVFGGDGHREDAVRGIWE